MANEATFLKAVKKAKAVDKLRSAIFYGPSGTGKTILAASATDTPVLIVDIEGSAAGVGRIYPDVDVIEVSTHEMLEAVIDQLLNREHPYKTVIFDTLNVAQNRAEEVFRQKPEHANNKFGVWGDLKRWTVDFVRKMHHAPFTAIFVAHEEREKDEHTGRISTQLKLAGAAKSDVPTVVDLIGFTNYFEDAEGNAVRGVLIGKHASITTKNRFGIDGVLLPKPGAQGVTMTDIQEAINGISGN